MWTQYPKWLKVGHVHLDYYKISSLLFPYNIIYLIDAASKIYSAFCIRDGSINRSVSNFFGLMQYFLGSALKLNYKKINNY